MSQKNWSQFSLDDWGDFTVGEWDTFLLDPTGTGVLDGNIGSGIIYGTGYLYGDIVSSKHFDGGIYATGYLTSDFISSKNFEAILGSNFDASGFFTFFKNNNLDFYIRGGSILLEEITLYVNGTPLSVGGTLPLFLCNYATHNNLDLIIEGQGINPNFSPFNDYIFLFIGDHYKVYNSLPFFISSYTSGVNDSLNLFISSSYIANTGLDMFTKAYGISNDYLSLFSYGF